MNGLCDFKKVFCAPILTWRERLCPIINAAFAVRKISEVILSNALNAAERSTASTRTAAMR